MKCHTMVNLITLLLTTLGIGVCGFLMVPVYGVFCFLKILLTVLAVLLVLELVCQVVVLKEYEGLTLVRILRLALAGSLLLLAFFLLFSF